MSQAQAIDRADVAEVDHSATALFTPANESAPTSTRARVALVGQSGPHLTLEVESLLRGRLRIATLITMAGFLVYLIRTLVEPRGAQSLRPIDQVLHALIVAIQLALTAVLWSNWRISLRALRGMELLLFGTAALYFAWLQFVVFSNGFVLQFANPDVEGSKEIVTRQATGLNGLRWMLLIVLYGTFIPNTWKRCALVVGAMAMVPLGLTLISCQFCEVMGPFAWKAFFDLLTVMGVSSAIAIFGSYKISALQQEALQARKLGQYQLKKLLGAGGMGEVYLGEHLLLRRACAIKLIRPEQAGDPMNLHRFEREVRAMATLTHWNTVEVYDYGHDEDGTFYYVMEYLPGLSLQELVERHGPLPPGRVVHFLRQVCDALREAHATGLIHRDIKPSNVIACERGRVQDVAKLLDFGLVQQRGLSPDATKLTIQGTILGSPPYMSPEQALGKSKIDRRTDIYSLGAVAYFLTTGQTPFVRETAMELLVAHVHEQVTPPRDLRPEVPEDLEKVILTCLTKDPEQRFQCAENLERALAECQCATGWGRVDAAGWWKEISPRSLQTAGR